MIVGVEDQRMLSKTPNATIVEAPEGDSFDYSLVFTKYRKEFCVRLGLSIKIFDRWRYAVARTSADKATTKLTSGRSANGNVQLSDANFLSPAMRNPLWLGRCPHRERCQFANGLGYQQREPARQR